MDRGDAPPMLRHEVALWGEEAVIAPALEQRCGGDNLAADAQRISGASKDRLLRCAVCGSAVKKVFGSRRRWHFALLPGAAPCDHENETLEHRESKLGLYYALRSRLPGGWSVLLEERLENARRPDVLAVHESGIRVAFEVQYTDLSVNDWRGRHEDYAGLGVRDVWMLGHAREGRKRDALASVLAATEGQRIVYLGRREGERAVRAREAHFGGSLGGEVPYAKPGTATPGAFVTRWQGSFVADWLEYGPDAIGLSEDGTLRTPADDAFERLRRKAERQRKREDRRRKVAVEHRRAKAERSLERQERIGHWLTSTCREEARAELGWHLVNRLEREEDLDRAVLAHPGEWKTWIFLSHVHGKAQGSTFDPEVAAEEILERFGATGGASDAAEAVRLFLLLLRDEGFLANPKAGIASPGNGRRRYVVTGTAEGWTRRLEERIGRPRG